MDIFKELSDMNFKEAYNELSTIAFEESKQVVRTAVKELWSRESSAPTNEDALSPRERPPYQFG